MVETRNSKTSKAKAAASPQRKTRTGGAKATTAASRELAGLEIEATAALGGKQTAPNVSGESYKSSGGYWADVAT